MMVSKTVNQSGVQVTFDYFKGGVRITFAYKTGTMTAVATSEVVAVSFVAQWYCEDKNVRNQPCTVEQNGSVVRVSSTAKVWVDVPRRSDGAYMGGRFHKVTYTYTVDASK